MRRTLDKIRRDITTLQRSALERRTAEVVAVDRTTDPIRVQVKFNPTDTTAPWVDCYQSVAPVEGDTVDVIAARTTRQRVAGIVSAAQWMQPDYENSWTAYTADGHAGLRWRVEPGAVVRLDGAVTGGTLAATIFTLPDWAAPPSTVTIPAVSNGVFAYLTVSTAGEVAHVAGGSNAWVAAAAAFPIGT